MSQTLFDRCGGFAKLRRVVVAFYDKLIGSPVLGRHFAGADMARLIDHQTKFIATVMGGPASFTDEALRRAHARLQIGKAEFIETARLLCETLEEFGLSEEDVEQVKASFLSRESVIVAEPGTVCVGGG